MHLCIKHSWSHCIFLMIITFPPKPSPWSIPISPFNALCSCFSEDDTNWGWAKGGKWRGGCGRLWLTVPNGTFQLGPPSAGYVASRLVLTELKNSAHHYPLRDSRKVLWCFIMQIIIRNAVEDPKSPLRFGASLSPRCVMYPCRSPADTLIVHSCPPSPCQQQALLTLSCPHKAMLIRTTKTFLFLCVMLKVLTSRRLLKHGAIKLTQIWLKMWLHQVTDAWAQSSHRQWFQKENKELWNRKGGKGLMRLQIDEGSKNDVIRASRNQSMSWHSKVLKTAFSLCWTQSFNHNLQIVLTPLVLARTITATVHHIRNSLMWYSQICYSKWFLQVS